MARRFSPDLHKRVAIIFLLAIVFIGASWMRLGYLQIVRHPFLKAEALKQRYRAEQVVPNRGAILDRDGTPLAITVFGHGVYVVPDVISDPERVAEQLAAPLGRRVDELVQQLSGGSSSVWLTDRLDRKSAEAIEQLKLPGVYVVERPQRDYPHGTLAADVLGYTGRDNQGLAGLEHHFDTLLAGVPGRHFSERDPRGRAIGGGRSELEQPVPGSDLVLTIDHILQYTAEHELAKGIEAANAAWGLAIIMQPSTGEILAMTVLPDFDPADYQRYLPRAHRNPAVADQFEPGSTLKVFTVAAALEEGLVTLDSVLDGPATLRIGGGIVHCHNPAGYGQLSVADAVAVSCNTALAHLGAEMLGGEKLAEYMSAFGFGQRLGVDLPGEIPGSVPTPGRVYGELLRWATVSFGQGIAVTPLQLVTATSAIANGGKLMKPYIVREVRDTDGQLLAKNSPTVLRDVVSTATARDVATAMEAVVERGTGRRAQVPGYRVAGKTGTAQIPEGGIYGQKRLASFIGFAPADNPALLVLVMLYDVKQDTAEGGRWAAPVFADIMRRSLQHLGIPPTL